MKKLLFILMFLTSMISAQELQPTIGIHWTGGLSYDMENELPSLQLGALYSFPEDAVLTNISLSGNYYYDFIPEKDINKHSYYVLKIQPAKEFLEFWNVTGYVGYIDSFKGNLAQYYKTNNISKLAWGGGIQTFDDNLVAELLYENFGGFSQLSIGLNYKFGNILKN